METLARSEEILREVGFVEIGIEDRSQWYRCEA